MNKGLGVVIVLATLVLVPMTMSASTNIPVTGQVETQFSCTISDEYAQAALTDDIWHLSLLTTNTQRWGRISGSSNAPWSISAAMSPPYLSGVSRLTNNLKILTTSWTPTAVDVNGWSYSHTPTGTDTFSEDYTLSQVMAGESAGQYSGTITFTCINTGTAAVVCGDGSVGTGEACDDGDTTSADGCSSTCTIESGYQCTGNPSVCSVVSVTCDAGLGNCNGLSADGCEVNLQTSASNCGSCGHVCTATNGVATCLAGSCSFTCNPPYANCDGSGSNGCESNLATSVSSCGACGHACPTPPNAQAMCSASTCQFTCNTGYANCDGNAANGCEHVGAC